MACRRHAYRAYAARWFTRLDRFLRELLTPFRVLPPEYDMAGRIRISLIAFSRISCYRPPQWMRWAHHRAQSIMLSADIFSRDKKRPHGSDYIFNNALMASFNRGRWCFTSPMTRMTWIISRMRHGISLLSTLFPHCWAFRHWYASRGVNIRRRSELLRHTMHFFIAVIEKPWQLQHHNFGLLTVFLKAL